MNVKFLVGDPESKEGPRGIFKFYRDLWDEKQLGKRPVANPLELLERDKAGKPLSENNYSIGGMKEYWACLNNPAWRDVLKAWTKVAVARGVDGLMINYFYRHDCHCPHCVAGFKKYMAERHTPDQLRTRFAIADLAKHQFDEIVAWHDPAKSTPLRREMLRWSQIANKQAFDEVFVKYGRSLKPDFIAGQWNHMRITAVSNNIQVILNNEVIVETAKHEHPELGLKSPRGLIGFQNYGDRVQFRNIKGNDVAQFKDTANQAVVAPGDFASGTVIYPFESAK
jgi:hypothetical protein